MAHPHLYKVLKQGEKIGTVVSCGIIIGYKSSSVGRRNFLHKAVKMSRCILTFRFFLTAQQTERGGTLYLHVVKG